MSVRVLLVDDQPLLRTGFRMILEETAGVEVVGEAHDGVSALREAAQLSPDVILMDIRMPGMDGLEATRRLTASASSSRVLILTTFDLDEYAYAALRAGASGFVLKDAPISELVGAIQAVAQGHAVVAPRVTRLLLDAYAHRLPDPTQNSARATLERLTPREREVFLQMARGLTNAEIAQQLVVSEATVKTHVGAVLTKLDLRNRVAAVILAYDLDLVD